MAFYRSTLLTACGLVGLISSLAAAPTYTRSGLSDSQSRVALPGHRAPLVAISEQVGTLAPTERLSLALSLPLRNQAALTELLKGLYDPADPRYGEYLTGAEFTAQFGPTQRDYDAVIAFVRAQGLTVTETHPERTLLNVTGPAKAVEAAFGVKLKTFEDPNGRLYHAPSGEASIPAALAGRISSVVGLDNSAQRFPNMKPLPAITATGAAASPQGTGPGGGLTPSDIRTIYNLTDSTLTGQGQTLGLFELDNYTPKDPLQYERAFHLPLIPLENVYVDLTDKNFPKKPGGGTDEVVLDIEMQAALAPKAAKILVYVMPNDDSGVVDGYQRIATDNRAKSISTSWGLWEAVVTPSNFLPEYNAFQQMAVQGQTIFAAAGDYGGIDPYAVELPQFDLPLVDPQDPATQPFMCAVGGTEITVANPGVDESYVSETTWNVDGNPFDGAGGGGISAEAGLNGTGWPIPYYQIGAAERAQPDAAVSLTNRNIPDISLNSSQYTPYLYGVTDPTTGVFRYGLTGGTSAAAPLWAGFTAIVNQKRAAIHKKPIGQINLALYRLGPGGSLSSRYSADFHDIADGSNNIPFVADTGYDDATGLGTMRGANLLSDLVAFP